MSRATRIPLISILLLALGCSGGVQRAPQTTPGAASTGSVPRTEERSTGALTAAIPLDPAVRHGTLDNGLAFYIRANKKPENRAEVRLALNAGSIQEDDDQRGLAHFVEHMAFNGTENFEKQ